MSIRSTESRGIDYVKDKVNSFWNSKWHDISAQNDDGCDGFIELYKGSDKRDTGALIRVQVKCGSTYEKKS